MSNDSPVLTSLTENSTELPLSAGRVDNYVLLLVLLCVFAGGTLILLSVLLLFCHRCCVVGRRYSRASDDPEKTNTTCVEDSQPTQDITVRLNESDALSASGCHDEESDRFTSNYSTGRRVSFNESALYEKESKTPDKGRRYTLTEGDFHHLKKARLTHLHLAPPSSALKILTIMECESMESSSLNINDPPAPKPPLYQSSEMPAWLRQSSSGALPGDTHHSVLLDPRVSPPGHRPLTPRSRPMGALSDKAWDRTNRERARCMSGTEGAKGLSLSSGHQDSVLQLLCKMTRHASLEGAGPYFRRWKFNSSQRAASLDAKGSPKRRPFQRQRAASDNTDPTEEDSPNLHLSPPLCRHNTPTLPIAHSQIGGIQRLSAGLLTQPTCPPSPCLSRLEVEAVVEAASRSGEGEVTHPPPDPPGTQDREQKPGEVTGTGVWREAGTETRAEAAEEVEVWVGSEEESGEEGGAERGVSMAEERMVGLSTDTAQERETRTVNGCGATSQPDAGMGVRAKTGLGAVLGTEKEAEASLKSETVEGGTPGIESEVDAELRSSEVRIKADSGTAIHGSGSVVYIDQQESSETQPSQYRDIWSLRASLEQYASSDQSSTDRESIRSDADSVCSVGGAAARSGFAACLSQDLGDEPEGEWEFGEMERERGGGEQREADGDEEYRDTGKQIGHRGIQERQSGQGGGAGDVEAGGRKLLQMDSGYTSIEAPIRAPEELRLFGTPAGPRGKTASERRLFFTSSGRKGSVCESFEAKVFQEELEDDMGEDSEVKEKPMKRSARPSNGRQLAIEEPSQSPSQPKSLQSPQPVPSPRPVRLRRRDYSIDEKTDALFNEFLRHDPRFDQQESPLRSRHRSRIHLRKQWQRHKQYSDPGSGGRYSPSMERQSFRPLRRGDSAGYLLDTRCHSTLSRIASAADEEANEGASEGMTSEGSAGGSKGTACEGALSQSADVKESTNKSTGNNIVANEDAPSQPSDALRAKASGMDPSVDNYNNNSSQALNYSSSPIPDPGVVLPEPLEESIDPPALHTEEPESLGLNPNFQPPSPSLSDKLSVSLEDRLYTGLWRTGQGQGGPECVVGAIPLSSSPEPSSPL
ncbi:uncharacterized protein LOC105020690 isoform X2 [Esox lucius]|uniref:Voltage-dependent calcium channel beta subunit-associated regulatory protein-like n=1 Tax=Esox lucius TaxID=8010 RepID=A0A3P8XXE7_ESOLU|nr:uncharacterized protein LOC105020690 isoform X2 [Esox lucius]